MKKILLGLIMLVWCGIAQATSLNIPYQNEQPGGVIKSGDWNADMQAIAQWANNNNIDGSTNIATAGVTTSAIANGAVTNAKIDSTAGIFTYGDVYGSALISLSSIASSAGEIPTANLGTGTAGSGNLLLGTQTWGQASNAQISGVLGTWTSLTYTTIYHAATDGIAMAEATVSGGSFVEIKTDSNSSPTTNRAYAYNLNASAITETLVCPVRKGDYWFIDVASGGGSATSVEFIPLGS